MPFLPRIVGLLALALAACAGDATQPATSDRSSVDSARAILTRLTPAFSDSAFRRLNTLPYNADVRTRDAGGRGVHRQVRNERHMDGSTSLRTVSGTRGTAVPLDDPVSSLLPGNPPYLAPRTRDRYRVRLLRAVAPDGRRLVGAEAALVDNTDQEPVRRVRAWTVAGTGEPYALDVVRRTSSAIFDEAGRAGVRFAPGPAGILPAAAASRARIDVPFGPPRIVELDIRIDDVGR